jgi:hypothetical protein
MVVGASYDESVSLNILELISEILSEIPYFVMSLAEEESYGFNPPPF